MANQWFRMYAEFAADPKVQMMSEVDQRRFVMVLCLRCSNDRVTLQDDEVAFQLRISNDEWARTKALFLQKGLIGEDNTPTAWDRRQFVSDSSAERVRRHRDKKKKEAKQACNVTATPPEADTEADTEAEEKRAALPVGDPPTVTRQGNLCRRLRQESGITDAAPHQLDDSTWSSILAKRTDEEIVEFAKAKTEARSGQRTSLRYLAPGLLEDPRPIALNARQSAGTGFSVLDAIKRSAAAGASNAAG